jgi:hypothetical protein
MRKQCDFSKGRRGPALPSPGRTRITLMLDDDILNGETQQPGIGVAAALVIAAPSSFPWIVKGGKKVC